MLDNVLLTSRAAVLPDIPARRAVSVRGRTDLRPSFLEISRAYFTLRLVLPAASAS